MALIERLILAAATFGMLAALVALVSSISVTGGADPVTTAAAADEPGSGAVSPSGPEGDDVDVEFEAGPLLVAFMMALLIMMVLIRRVRLRTAQLHASEAHARHLAFHDVLTGLPNRAMFNERLEAALAEVRRGEGSLALMYLDLDRFKQVNDTLGHPAGDELICETGRRLAAAVRGSDTVARLGGDEFAIIQTPVGDKDIEDLCRRILDAVHRPFNLGGFEAFAGVSIGVATAGAGGPGIMEIMRRADIALYEVKRRGRGDFAIFRAELDTAIRTRQEVESDLRNALAASDQLQVLYQPVLGTGSDLIVGVEAVLRWWRPGKGMTCPSAFMPVAEECGLVESLGHFVLEEACRAASAWPVDRISVNVHAMQLRNPSFAGRVRELLASTALDPRKLELAIDESALLDGTGAVEASLAALKEAGVKIALVGFGTGYSSFAHLKSFDIDRVKIDRSFIDAAATPGEAAKVLRAIVDLVHASGLRLTARGVETEAQGKELRSAGCDELQTLDRSGPLPVGALDGIFGSVVRRASSGPAGPADGPRDGGHAEQRGEHPDSGATAPRESESPRPGADRRKAA